MRYVLSLDSNNGIKYSLAVTSIDQLDPRAQTERLSGAITGQHVIAVPPIHSKILYVKYYADLP